MSDAFDEALTALLDQGGAGSADAAAAEDDLPDDGAAETPDGSDEGPDDRGSDRP
jgi:hypothetical protein